jgi:hypothetical protein
MSQVLLGAKVDGNDATNLYGNVLGARFTNADGKEYMFVQAAEAITQYMYVSIDEAFLASKITKTLADTRTLFGACQTALTSAYYGWVQIRGAHTGLVKASCAADVKLYTSATAGYLDDDATSQTAILGAVLTTARGGTDGSAAALFTVEAQAA